jgi:glutathione peroxidase
MSVYDQTLPALDGTGNVLEAARGKTTLFVNVASQCGLTPQYTGLQELYDTLGGDDFTVVGVPCNQFGAQEPGSPEEIAEFCSTSYSVTFPISAKVDVNGDDRHPLYAELTESADADGHSGDSRWNFEKFLVGPDGSVIERFGPMTAPEDPALVAAIHTALGR